VTPLLRMETTMRWLTAALSDIRVGNNIYSAVIAGCLDPGFGGDALPVKKTAAKPQY
jgi:hypothetical protein